jgi:hypothetical protein
MTNFPLPIASCSCTVRAVKRLALLALGLLGALGALGACAGTIEGGPGGGGDDQNPPDDSSAVGRAMQWVEAMVPYCQAPNHKPDPDAACPSVCDRPDVADWDPYRSDCSGLVSWAWDLPAPGRITDTFAPYDTTVSHAITASDLAPGDAVNNDHHIMLFKEWVTPGSEATFIDEPGCSSSEPFARELTADVTLDGQTITVQYHGTFTAIRED